MSFLKRLFGFGDKKPADIVLRASSPVVPRRNPLEIESTPEMIEEDLRFKARQMELLEVRIRDSGLYRIEKVPELMDKLSGKVPFARNSNGGGFGGDTFLSLAEKKALGLNTRAKYSHEFIACCEPSMFSAHDPKQFLEGLRIDVFHEASREKDIAKYKSMGFIKRVKINTVSPCAKVKRLKKVYVLNEAPHLPLPGCDVGHCMCFYSAVIEDSE